MLFASVVVLVAEAREWLLCTEYVRSTYGVHAYFLDGISCSVGSISSDAVQEKKLVLSQVSHRVTMQSVSG
jgi:hypothetical protein